MESTFGLKEKQLLLLKKIDQTEKRYGLDKSGDMLGMVGKILPINAIVSSFGVSIYCENAGRNFTFSINDFESPQVKEPDPIIFKYDPQNLDI